MRFVECWYAIAGRDPQWLYFDAKLVPSAELSRGNPRGIWLVTMRCRGAALLRRLQGLPAYPWRQTTLHIPKRQHPHVRYVDEIVTLRGYKGPIRQLAFEGLGRRQFTLLVSNNFDTSTREFITRYAGRNSVEDSLGISVNFFHLDCLASEGRLHVDVDVALTVLAHGCYPWWATQLHGFDTAKPKQLSRQCVETGGRVAVQAHRLVVHFEKRAHHAILREAALDAACPAIPWLHNLPVAFKYP